MRGMGTYGASNNSSSNEASFSPPSRLKRTSSMGPMSPIAEIDDKSLVGRTNRDNSYVASFSMGSWDDTAMVSDNITGGLKRLKEDDDDVKQFAALESQVTHKTSNYRSQRRSYTTILILLSHV